MLFTELLSRAFSHRCTPLLADGALRPISETAVCQWYTFIRLKIIRKTCMILPYSILFNPTVMRPLISVPCNQCKVKTEET